jgi:hypothetical protein
VAQAKNQRLQNDLGNLQAQVAELREQLETERASREKITNLAPIAHGVEFAEPAIILSQLRARRKKSKTDLADLEVILEILES